MEIEPRFMMEVVGVALSLAGALLVATRRPAIGYSLMSASCVFIAVALSGTAHSAIVIQNLTFLAINIVGLIMWTRRPSDRRRYARTVLYDSSLRSLNGGPDHD